MTSLEHLWVALEDGRYPQALELAEEMFVRSPHAASNQEEAAQELKRLYCEAWRPLAAIRFEEEIVPVLGPAGDAVLELVRADLDLFHQWRERLGRIADERLAEEFVGAVKANDLKRAFELARSLEEVASTAAERVQRARHIGVLLGSLVAERERARRFVQDLARHAHELGLDGVGVGAMLEEYERAAVAIARRENVSASTSRQELTQAIVEMSRSLPDRMALHEPRREEYERFWQVVRAIVVVALTSPRLARYYEATCLFVEFAPKEYSSTSARAGVEQRLYATLGRTARLIASRALAALGKAAPVWQSYLRFAREGIWNKRIAPLIVEVIGLMRNPEAVEQLKEWYAEKRLDVQFEVVSALGSLASEAAIEALLEILRGDVRKRPVVGELRREAIAVLQALGRAGRSLDPTARSNLLQRVIQILPPDDSELHIRTVLAFLSGPLEGMDPKVLTWAASVATRALWHVERPELERAGRTAPLGFRQPLIDVLERLAPHALPTINAITLEQAKTFCGAYLAVAELYAKLATPETLPVLRQLLMNTFLHDDKPKTPYQRETVLEPGTEERSELTRDKVLAALVYAVSKIQSEEADELLAELFEQVRSGRLPRPGPEMADVLMQAYMRVGQKRGEGPLGVFPGSQSTIGEEFAEAAAATSLTPEELSLLRDLEAKFLLASKRRAVRVAALAGLAKHRTLAALPKIIDHLTDKDPIVAAAAATALTDYARPPVKPHVLERLHAELLSALQVGNDGLRAKVVDVLKRLGPRRSPLKERLETLVANGVLDGTARRLVASLVEAPPPPPGTPGTQKQTGESKPAANGTSAQGAATGPKHISELEKRRQYLLARQAWIRGGKRGPEPKPPE